MSDLHLRGCLCDECCPGFKAQATRVYRVSNKPAELTELELEERKAERRRQRHRARYRALRLAGLSWAEAQRARGRAA